MDKNNIINEYFEWMTNIVCGKRFSGKMTYKKLLSCLHMITFRCEMRSDENRAEDGVDLRWRFAVDTGRENQNDWIRDQVDNLLLCQDNISDSAQCRKHHIDYDAHS